MIEWLQLSCVLSPWTGLVLCVHLVQSGLCPFHMGPALNVLLLDTLLLCLTSLTPLLFFLAGGGFRATLAAYRNSPGRGETELQLWAYTTATATQNLSQICDLHHSSQ